MLTSKATLNLVWNNGGNDNYAKMCHVFYHYAKPSKLAQFFHRGRTSANQEAVMRVIETLKDSAEQSPEFFLTTLINETYGRNPQGELEHRIKYVCQQLELRMTIYHEGNNEFGQQIAKIAGTLDNQTQLETIQQAVNSDEDKRNRIIITKLNEPNTIVSVSLQVRESTENSSPFKSLHVAIPSEVASRATLDS